MKRLVSILLALLLCLGLSGCGDKSSVPPRPKDKAFEFWITEGVELEDFSGHDEVAGLFGGFQYLGKGYHAVFDENGMNASPPDIYVLYTITAYPDYSSGTLAVTTIEITDPAVTLYGLTVSSSLDEWDAVMREMGYEVSEVGSAGLYHSAKKGGFSFFYGDGSISISAEVTNREGIIF